MENLKELIAACGVAHERLEHLDDLQRLYGDLLVANRRDNLTAVTDEREYWLKHVLDSLSIALAVPEILTEPLAVADVGCGAGFPLLPLAWANPELRIVGIETRHKKTSFIQHEIQRLGFVHCSALAMQAREVGRTEGHAGRYDVVLLRAVAAAGRMVRECRNLLAARAGSRIIFYKTPDAVVAELPVAIREADKYGLQVSQSPIFTLPEDAGTRQFLILRRA